MSKEYEERIAKATKAFYATADKPLEMTKVKAENLAVGMVVKTWFGTWAIAEILAYTGPFAFVVGVLRFHGTKSKMSICTIDRLDVTVESLALGKQS